MRFTSGFLKAERGADESRLKERVANARCPGVIACDAKMEPMQFGREEWYNEAEAQVKALAGGVSTLRAMEVGIKDLGTVLDQFTARESLANTIDKVEVVEEHSSNQESFSGL